MGPECIFSFLLPAWAFSPHTSDSSPAQLQAICEGYSYMLLHAAVDGALSCSYEIWPQISAFLVIRDVDPSILVCKCEDSMEFLRFFLIPKKVLSSSYFYLICLFSIPFISRTWYQAKTQKCEIICSETPCKLVVE